MLLAELQARAAKAGTTIIATAGTAIYAEDGNVSLAGTVTATAKHSEGYGIYASGSITVAKTTIPMSDVAIGAVDGNITINGEVNAKSTNTCIGTVEGTLTINADVTATTSKSAALLSRSQQRNRQCYWRNFRLLAIWYSSWEKRYN